MAETRGATGSFVFSDVDLAGRFALQLADLVAATKWDEKGLPADLSLRIALHAGPVYEFDDPVTGSRNLRRHPREPCRTHRTDHTGGTSLRERSFAALAATCRTSSFSCDYVGQTPIAKGYGICQRTTSGQLTLLQSCKIDVNSIGVFHGVAASTCFISAVTAELRSARQLVANTLMFLGYEPVWQDIFGTEGGDLREVLRKQIDECNGVVQLVGKCYGAEPPQSDEKFGRVSYTQYEALYAREQGKKVWYLFIDEHFPADSCDAEPDELRVLQATYRRRVQADTHLFHPLTSREGLEMSVLKLRDDLTRLRRGVKQWAAGFAILLIIFRCSCGNFEGRQALRGSLTRCCAEASANMRKPKIGFARARRNKGTKGKSARNSLSKLNLPYRSAPTLDLAKQLEINPKLLREKLPKFAEQLKRAPDATSYERANAAYVVKDYSEAERLALQAADEALKADPPNLSEANKAFELAGRSADERIEDADALRHFREAEKFTDRQRDPIEWARVQWDIAKVLDNQSKSSEAEKILRSAVAEYQRVRGDEDKDTLTIRDDLATALYDQDKFGQAEAEYRAVLKIREKVLGLHDRDTLASRDNLAAALEDQGKYAEAEAEHRAVLKIREKVLGPRDS